MLYEWDKIKNALNIQNHGISFEEAKEVFDDPLHIAKLDFRFNYFEERCITLGATSEYKLIVVAHMLFNQYNEEVIRIISARKANNKEVSIYEK